MEKIERETKITGRTVNGYDLDFWVEGCYYISMEALEAKRNSTPEAWSVEGRSTLVEE